MTRFVFVTGGVVSSLGKGIASASLGAILEARGLKVGGLGGGNGLVDGVGHVTRAHRDVEAGEVLLALVLEQVHQEPSSRASSDVSSH